jgi:putative ABC transport system permease protein
VKRDPMVVRTATTLTRVLLRVYPPSFRNHVGHEVLGDVRRRATELSASHGDIRVGVWLVRHGASLVANAVATWRDETIASVRDHAGRPRATFQAGSWVPSWLDLKLAVRMLGKYPGLALVGGLGIAVGVAVGVGFFALFHSRFFPEIPLSEGHRLVGLENWDRRTNREERRSLHDFALWQTEMKSVEDMAAFRTVARNAITEDGSVESVQIAEITPSGFRLARVPPLLGRSLVATDASLGAAEVIVIGFDVWTARFASAPDIVGRTLRLGNTVHTIVGVMPDGFAFPVRHRYWTPLKANPSQYKRGEGPSIFIAGRLAAGFDIAGANAELTVIGTRMATEFPDTHQHLRPEVVPYTYPFAGMSGSSADGFWPLTILVSLILVVVCVNVAILIYARTATRMGEIAVRSALGASRGRIVAQLFAESLVLSVGAATVGLIVVKIGLDWVRSSLAVFEDATFWADYTLSGTAFIYFVALTVLAAIITGVVPALRATGRRVTWNFHQFNIGAGLRMGRTWTTLIVVQVSVAAAAIPIIIAVGWFEVRDIFNVPTFPVEQILFAEVELDREPPAGQDASVHQAAQAARFSSLQAELSRRLDAQPGVIGRAFTLDLPTMGRPWYVAIENGVTGSTSNATRKVQRATIDLDFLRTFGLALLAGRSFRPGDLDDGSADVVLVDRSFVNRVLGGAEALGRRVRYASETPRGSPEPRPERWYEIVGVVENIARNPFGRDLVDPRVYHPLKDVSGSRARLALRVDESQHRALARRLPEIAAAIDPTIQITALPLIEAYRLQRTALTTAALGIGVSLLSVILLSAAGIYALMSFTVAQRRREIAIRTALGAQPARLLGGIFGRAVRQIAVGVVLGAGLTLLVDVVAEGEALRGSAGVLVSGTALVMSVVGLLAALGPARRGLRIEPSEALKSE